MNPAASNPSSKVPQPSSTPYAIPKLLSLADVADLLEVSPAKLHWWLYGLWESRRYHSFSIHRRTGGTRRIDTPIKPIKDMQHSLARVLTAAYEPPPTVHGYAQRRSISSNAARHVRKRWVLRVDLVDFFPTIHFGRVRGLFLARPFEYPANVATVLAQLCCNRGKLPIGAPTSPIISNLICRSLDRDLAALARTERAHYSRYADDLIFSTDRRFPPNGLVLVDPTTGAVAAAPALARLITGHGFSINLEKTRLYSRGERQMVTGLVVNRKVNVTKDLCRSLRMVLHIWKSHGPVEAERAYWAARLRNSPPAKAPDFRAAVRGQVQYVGQIRGWGDPRYRRLAEKLVELDGAFSPKTAVTLAPAASLQIYCEGKSDYKHLRAVFTSLHAAGERTWLQPSFDSEKNPPGSAQELATMCKSLAKAKPTDLVLCIFDSDVPKILRDVIPSGQQFHNLGNRVFAVTLQPPDWRSRTEPVCIELLYPEDIIQSTRDAAGRRLYLREEFDGRTGRHRSEASLNIVDPRSTTLVREEVFDDDGHNVALSKDRFAALILDQVPPLSKGSFDGFGPTLDLIEEVVEAARLEESGTVVL